MIFGKTKMEFKVGIFVFLGLILLTIFVLSIGGFKTWTSGYRVRFIFNFVDGVKLGAPVRFAGVDVGSVKKLKLFFDPKENKTDIEVVCWVKKEVTIPNDSAIWVNTLGLLGEKYIEIMPGKNYDKPLLPDQELAGENPTPMHEVTELAKNIGVNFNETIEKIKNSEGTIPKLLYNPDIYNQLDALIRDLRNNPWKIFWKTREKN